MASEVMVAAMQATKKLSQTLDRLRQDVRAPLRGLYDALVAHLTGSAIADGALRAGDLFPEFALPDDVGAFALSSDLLRRGPLVVNFYRGRWCPFCKATVKAMSDAAPAISAAGATVVGISPELGHLSFSTGNRHSLNFSMLSDPDNGLSLQCGLLFRLTDDIIKEYQADGLDLTKLYGNDSWFLPIPASYIVAPDGVIARAYINPDFRYRMDPDEILRSVAELSR